MDEVILSKNGALLDHAGGNVSDVLPVLGARIAPEPGYCLRSFVHMLGRYPLLQRLSSFAPGFAAQSDAWPKDGCWPAGLECMEFSRVVEIIGHPAPPRLEIYHTLRGRSTAGEDMEIKGYQVETLLDVPLRLGLLRHVVFGDQVQEFRFETVCNLFEFFEGVCWQLAFHGTPVECALRR